MATNLLDEVENAVERTPEYSTWGQAALSTYEVYLAKGQTPTPFDATIHPKSGRAVMVEIVIIPLDEMQAKFNTEFKKTSFSHEWAGVTLPSIKAIGLSVANLHDAWVKVIRKPNGKKYPKKDRTTGQLTGEMGELTDLLFLKVFENQEACLRDYLTEMAGEPVTAESAADFPAETEPAPSIPAAQAQAPDSLLLKFAQAMVMAAAKQAPGDLLKISEIVKIQIDKNTMFAGRFTADSPEIMAMIAEACK